MKKIIALLLAVVMVCCFAVTAFAAESPTATGKITVTVRKADYAEAGKVVDAEYTIEVGSTVTVKANAKYGTFKDWTIYKEEVVAGTSTTKMVEAVEGKDYELVKGGLTSSEVTVKILNASVVICANYGDVKTDPNVKSNADTSASAPQTGDMMPVCTVVVMLAAVAFMFGAKKVYSK